MLRRVRQTAKKHMQWAGHARWFRAFVALVFLTSLLVPALNWIDDIKSYALSPKVEKLIGPANENLSAKFTFDSTNRKWQFNKDGVASLAQNIAKVQGGDAEGIGGALSQLTAKQVGGSGKEDTSLYSVDLPVNAKEGITYFDNVTRLSFKMIPNFTARAGKMVDGRIVYPFSGSGQIVYTAKSNGLKEDIVLSKYLDDTLSYSYDLDLPETLEARLLDDGSIGVYSANPALFGNISFGNDQDRARVMDARTNGAKDNLVFGIPAPFIKDQKGQAGHTRYELNGGKLTVVAEGLRGLHYPLSVDPSVTVTSSSDFAEGNGEDAIDFASGQISRTQLTGGSIGSFTATSTMNTPRALMDSVMYNGYLYAVFDWTNQATTIEYAKIQSNGSLGAWTQQATGLSNRYGNGLAAYNGYLYITGGNTSGAVNTTSYAKLNSDGSIGTFVTASTTFNTARYFHKTEIYNGYIYVLGGRGDASGFDIPAYNSGRYAKLNADGSIGTWSSTTTMPEARLQFATAIYNNRLYIGGGFYYDNSPALDPIEVYTDNIKSVAINEDGSLGTTWRTETASAQVGKMTIYGGYMYIMSSSAISYAPIYLNGTIGTFESTTAPPNLGSHAGFDSYNGYIYKFGGGNGGSDLNTAHYAAINPAGSLGAFSALSNYTTAARTSFATVTYNNYLYAIGGSTGITGGRSDMVNTARYAPINADGSVGAWSTSSSGFNQVNSASSPQTCTSVAVCPGRTNIAAGVYNGYLYIAGGVSNGTADQWSDVQSAVICTGANTPVAGCAGAGDLRNWTTLYTDYLTNSTTTYTEANGRAQVAMQIYNGVMYLLGGHNSAGAGTEYSHIYQSTLTSTGGAGNFTLSSVSLPSARAAVKTFVHGGKLYIVGGGQGSGWASTSNEVNDVQFIPINPDGTLDGTTGWKDANAIGNGGSGSSFAASGAINDYGVSVSNGQIYVAGGRDNGTGSFAAVYRAIINANGSVGSWTTTRSITTARYGLKTAAVRGSLYVIGGCTQHSIVIGQNCNSAGNMLANYQYAQINNGGNGDVQSWNNTSTSLGVNRYSFGSFTYNGYLYVLGGKTNGGAVNSDQSIVYAPIANDGVVGTWTGIPNAPTVLGDETWAFYNGYVYQFGGKGNTNNAITTTRYAAVCTGANTTTVFSTNCTTSSTPGTLSSWNSGASMNTGRSEFKVVAYSGYLYAFGGCTSSNPRLDWICTTESNTVEVSQINSTTGAPGSWTALSSGNNFATPRFRHQAVAYNGYVYVMGGCANIPNLASACDTDLSDVQMAKLNGAGLAADAGCGAVWCSQDVIVNARMEFGAAAYNGYLYITGGDEGLYSDVRYAPISTKGALGRWSRANTDFTTVRRGHQTQIHDGRLYVIGGTNANATTFYGDVQFAGLKTIPRISKYSKLLTLNPTTQVAGVYYNGLLNGDSSVIYRVAPSTGIFGSFGPATYGSGSEPDPLCGLGSIYYVHFVITLKDTTTATFPESNVGNVTDVTTYYHVSATPPPNLRMNGGKWFYLQQQRPLDTCKQ